MVVPGWLWSLVIVVIIAGGTALLDALPSTPAYAEWWMPILVAVVTAIIAWLKSKGEEMGALVERSRWRRFWLG